MPRSRPDTPTARALLEHEIAHTTRQIEWVSGLLSETRNSLARLREWRRVRRRLLRLRHTESRA